MAAMDDDRASIQPADGFRVERDTMGEVLVPADALYRAQTQRAVQNFPISGTRLDVPTLEAGAGDREVLHRPLGLGAVERVRRDEHLAHRVALDAEAVGWLDARAVVVHGGHPPIGSAGARPGRRDSAGRGARLSPQPPAVAPGAMHQGSTGPVLSTSRTRPSASV